MYSPIRRKTGKQFDVFTFYTFTFETSVILTKGQGCQNWCENVQLNWSWCHAKFDRSILHSPSEASNTKVVTKDSLINTHHYITIQTVCESHESNPFQAPRLSFSSCEWPPSMYWRFCYHQDWLFPWHERKPTRTVALTHPSCVNSVVGISSSVQHKTLTQEDRYQLPAPHLPVLEVPQTGPKCHQPVYDPPSVAVTVPHHVTRYHQLKFWYSRKWKRNRKHIDSWFMTVSMQNPTSHPLWELLLVGLFHVWLSSRSFLSHEKWPQLPTVYTQKVRFTSV